MFSFNFGGVPVILEFGCTKENGGESNGAVMYLGSFYGLVACCTFYREKARLDLMTINFVGTTTAALILSPFYSGGTIFTLELEP